MLERGTPWYSGRMAMNPLSKDITIFSIPRTGTRFYMYFVKHVLGLRVRYIHSTFASDEKVRDFLDKTTDTIIVPVRPYEDIRKSWGSGYEDTVNDLIKAYENLCPSLLASGAHFMNIEKGPNSELQFARLLFDLGLDWTDDIRTFFEKWPRIGSQHNYQDEFEQSWVETAKHLKVVL